MHPEYIKHEGRRVPVFPYSLDMKRLRAEVIAKHLKQIGEQRCVCFTCGNAAAALRKAGVQVVEVGAKGKLKPSTWFGYSDIQQAFNGLFDATSGHLPMPLMRQIAARVRREKEIIKWIINAHTEAGGFFVPTGSGESIVVLAMAYPRGVFLPVRFKHPATKYDKDAPLNDLVKALTGKDVAFAYAKGKNLAYKPSAIATSAP